MVANCSGVGGVLSCCSINTRSWNKVRTSSSGSIAKISGGPKFLTRMPAELIAVKLLMRAVERVAISSAIQPPSE